MVSSKPPSPIKLDYGQPTPKKSGIGLFFFLVAVVALFAATSRLLHSLNRPHDSGNLLKCASNLRQIGQAILLYTMDYHGEYPDDLGTLLKSGEIQSDAFTCPGTNDTPAHGATTQAVVDALATPGHLSYIYLGKGRNERTVSAETVVAYEPVSNHENAGSNVLFGDGHVDFIAATKIRAMEAQFRARSGPATFPVSP